MVISRTPKREVRDDNEDGQLEQPYAMTFDPDPEEKVDPRDEKLKSLEEQIADMHRQLEEREQDRMLSVAMQPITAQPTFQPEKEVDVPSIDDDLQGYIAASTKNAEIRVRNELRRSQFSQQNDGTIEQKTQALYTQFANDYPELNEMGQDRLEFAAVQVAKRAHAKGVDVQRYMFNMSDRYLKDVANEMEKIFGPAEVNEDEEDFVEERTPRRGRPPARRDANPKPRNRRQRNRQEYDEDDGRSAGVFGGTSSGGRPSGFEREEGSMIDDMQEMQKKLGFY